MTHGTSARSGGLSGYWTDAGQERGGPHRGIAWRIAWERATREAAALQLPALSAVAGLIAGLSVTMTWQAAADTPLAVLLAAGAAAALAALRPREPTVAALREADRPHEPSRLVAQMQHELRTPLNTVIGFSEVILHELHGPLGNARYQEYAAHISESGGRLLKASEDALAVAATMSALLADRRERRRDRLPVALLVQEAWAMLEGPAGGVRLDMEDCSNIAVECDRAATSQALQHLLAEAIGRTVPGGAVLARTRCDRTAHCIEVMVEPCGTIENSPSYRPQGPGSTNDGLCLILARSLIEAQGAQLSFAAGPHARAWSACVAFPATAARLPALSRRRLSEMARRRAVPAYREDVAAVPLAAARASSQSPAAPPG